MAIQSSGTEPLTLSFNIKREEKETITLKVLTVVLHITLMFVHPYNILVQISTIHW